MDAPTTTSDRILQASLRLFNEKGYAATTLAAIAAEVGITQGNLTYHFPTKRDLVARLDERAREGAQARRARLEPGAVEDDYVEHLLFAMKQVFDHRFLLRDRAQFGEEPTPGLPDPDMASDFEELRGLLVRIDEAGFFRRDLEIDLEVLTRSLWIVSRYWMDHLRETEGLDRVTPEHQQRGIRQHFAVLHPCLTAAGRRVLDAAFERAAATTRPSDETTASLTH